MFSKYYVGCVRFYLRTCSSSNYTCECGWAKKTINGSFDFGFLVCKHQQRERETFLVHFSNRLMCFYQLREKELNAWKSTHTHLQSVDRKENENEEKIEVQLLLHVTEIPFMCDNTEFISQKLTTTTITAHWAIEREWAPSRWAQTHKVYTPLLRAVFSALKISSTTNQKNKLASNTQTEKKYTPATECVMFEPWIQKISNSLFSDFVFTFRCHGFLQIYVCKFNM